MTDEKCWFSRVIACFSVGRDVTGTLAREGAGQRHDGEIGKSGFENQMWQLITI